MQPPATISAISQLGSPLLCGGCSGESCPTGDQTDPVHHKHRCPAGQVVTGIISRSGDWLDSVEYVCSLDPLADSRSILDAGLSPVCARYREA